MQTTGGANTDKTAFWPSFLSAKPVIIYLLVANTLSSVMLFLELRDGEMVEHFSSAGHGMT